MADQFLTEIEREELLSKYKTENFRDAPANIKDSTLINNFGNDEQKQRLAASETANREEPKGTETETGTFNVTEQPSQSINQFSQRVKFV